MKHCLIPLFAFCLLGTAQAADPLTLDQLLTTVKQARSAGEQLNRDREAEFLAAQDRQQQLVRAAQAAEAAEQKLSQQLKAQIEANEQTLDQLQAELDARSGALRELAGVAKTAAGDLKAELEGSLVSAQYPGRAEQLAALADSTALPTLAQLQSLWFYLQQEMTEAGKVVKFKREILTAAGEPHDADVVRIGVFNALAGADYLNYLPETGQLVELARQPDDRYTDLAAQYVDAQTGPAGIGIDPTRGVILSLLIQTPDALERIRQGGVIGYIILALGAGGFLYALIRLGQLLATDRKVKRQMSAPEALDDNPLGRILATAEHSDAATTETLELVLDEAITREVPPLESGLSMIKLLAAVAPLLGLLGTVTGMIATFQSISLFGTGDPKLMASGISQALVTTMLGLCVAVPLLFCHSLLVSRSRALIQILDEQSAGLISRRAGR